MARVALEVPPKPDDTLGPYSVAGGSNLFGVVAMDGYTAVVPTETKVQTLKTVCETLIAVLQQQPLSPASFQTLQQAREMLRTL